MTRKTIRIDISGIVQGVGFRPFLFNLARDLDLKGYVLNRGNAGVRLVLQGESNKIGSFLNDIEVKRPKISYIEEIEVQSLSNKKIYDELKIKKSEQGRGISLTLPPDIAICENCIRDMRDQEKKRYYMYPFTACAVCGPRFTTVKELPYDRERSTMIEFPFCEDCLNEYKDFDNRRFHAQTYACSNCGPHYTLYDKNGHIIVDKKTIDILERTASIINSGGVVAVKGIGGVHLVCLATDKNVIQKLRERKGERKYKPFALMIPNLTLIEGYFHISTYEKDILKSFRRPIVLLEKNEKFNSSEISELVAPGLNNIGFMLPYSGIHYLLFDFVGNKPLIYTSGNKSNIPMAIENQQIFSQLYHLADFFLLHDRTIYQRADDSVLRIHDNQTKLIRRSRGYVPEYLPLPFKVKIPGALAVGPELAVTGAVLRRNRIFPTQHVGNVSHLETYEFLKDALFHMKTLLQIKNEEIKFIACDAHPEFITTKFAQELSFRFNVPLFPVQHHYSHILGLMAENKIDLGEEIIGISTDGVGYGDDGNIWGGEIVSCTYKNYKRLGHLEYQPMIGGDRCTKFPARMAASIILNALGVIESTKIFTDLNIHDDLEFGKQELSIIMSQYENMDKLKGTANTPLTSSTGRIFDTVSYLLGASKIKTYRGEPAMRLEGLASKGTPEKLELKLNYYHKNGELIFNTSELILNIIDLLQSSKYNKEDIAISFHHAIAEAYADGAMELARKNGIEKIGLTGGVAYNYFFSKKIKEEIEKNNYIFLEHDKVSPGDAGISTGQLINGIFKYHSDY